MLDLNWPKALSTLARCQDTSCALHNTQSLSLQLCIFLNSEKDSDTNHSTSNFFFAHNIMVKYSQNHSKYPDFFNTRSWSPFYRTCVITLNLSHNNRPILFLGSSSCVSFCVEPHIPSTYSAQRNEL